MRKHAFHKQRRRYMVFAQLIGAFVCAKYYPYHEKTSFLHMRISCRTAILYLLNRQTLNDRLHVKTFFFCICENKGADQSSAR